MVAWQLPKLIVSRHCRMLLVYWTAQIWPSKDRIVVWNHSSTPNLMFTFRKLVPATRHSCKCKIHWANSVMVSHTNGLLSILNRRKSISGSWKTNQGQAMLEQIQMTEKYKGWIDEVSQCFEFCIYLLVICLTLQSIQFD